MAVNPKSLENLKKHTTEELKAYGSYGGRVKAQKQRERNAAANAAIEAAAILNKALPKDLCAGFAACHIERGCKGQRPHNGDKESVRVCA